MASYNKYNFRTDFTSIYMLTEWTETGLDKAFLLRRGRLVKLGAKGRDTGPIPSCRQAWPLGSKGMTHCNIFYVVILLYYKYPFSYVCLILQPDLIYDISKAQISPCSVKEIENQ